MSFYVDDNRFLSKFYCCYKLKEQGAVLVMALLYLLIVSLLVASAFQASTLQTKISIYFSHAAIALQNAESALLAGESAVDGKKQQGEGQITRTATYSFYQRPETQCGLVYYQVNALGTHHTAQVKLESILLIPVAVEVQCPDGMPILLRQRVAWRQNLAAYAYRLLSPPIFLFNLTM